MADKAMTSHITPEEIADYFQGLLPQDREGVIEEHLADCSECIEQARRYRSFSRVWNRWTAQAHGEAHRRAGLRQDDPASPVNVEVAHEQAHLGVLLTGALRKVQEGVQNTEWRQRLESWQVERRAEAAVRLIIEAPEKALRLVTKGLETLVPREPAWQFGLASGAARVRGARTRGSAQTGGSGRSQVRVTVSHEQGELVVRVNELSPGQHPPLVLLIPTKSATEPKIAELERQPLGEYLARFVGVTPEDYVVAFEPMEQASK